MFKKNLRLMSFLYLMVAPLALLSASSENIAKVFSYSKSDTLSSFVSTENVGHTYVNLPYGSIRDNDPIELEIEVETEGDEHLEHFCKGCLLSGTFVRLYAFHQTPKPEHQNVLGLCRPIYMLNNSWKVHLS